MIKNALNAWKVRSCHRIKVNAINVTITITISLDIAKPAHNLINAISVIPILLVSIMINLSVILIE